MKPIYVPDIECDSCVKLIDKNLFKHDIKDYKITKESVDINEKDTDQVISIIKRLGFRASTKPFERKTFKERLRHFKDNKHLYKIEMLGIKHSFNLLITLLVLSTIAYFLVFSSMENFIGTYAWWIIYLIISVTSISVATWHYTAYSGKITCMTGMMIGMTFGMQTGMMIGAIIGATNGFFWGSMFGMLLGTAIGSITGRCCGIMGVMEGAMAGVMGGTMGSMIAVMMLFDNLLWFMPFYMIINIGIILGLSLMLYEEVVEGKEVSTKPLDGFTLVSIGVLVTTLLVWFMVYGPSSSLLGA